MLFAYKRFLELFNDTQNVKILYEYIENTMKAPIDTSDLLRWQWVQCISAFDKFVHDIVRIGMIDIFQGNRLATPKYNTFQMDIQTYVDMQNSPLTAVTIFEQKIILKHSFLAFQDPGKVADALSYIWNDNDKWATISSMVGMSRNDCVTFLKNAVIRRNQIVHEGDYTDVLAKRQDIYEQDVNEIRQFILKIGKAIYDCVI